MTRRESFSGDLARVAQRVVYARELAPARRQGWRAPRPASWPPPLPAHRVPVPPPSGRRGDDPPSVVWPIAPLEPPLRYEPDPRAAFWGLSSSTAAPPAVADDDNPFRRRSRWTGWLAALTLLAMMGAAGAVAELRPRWVPRSVARSFIRADAMGRHGLGVVRDAAMRAGAVTLRGMSVGRDAALRACAVVTARVVPQPHGVSVAAASSAPPRPPEPPPPPSATGLSVSASATEPPEISVTALPQAPADSPTGVALAIHPAAASPGPKPRGATPATPQARGARPLAASPTVRRASSASPAPAAVEGQGATGSRAASTPLLSTPRPAPAPAPGSLDDLIRKAVEADAKKKH
jgi:hypothetical protein